MMNKPDTFFFRKVWNLLRSDKPEPEKIDPEVRETVERIFEISKLEEPDYDKLWYKIAPKPWLRALRPVLRYAAIVIPLLFGASLLFFHREQAADFTKSDKPVTLTLSDGSVINLDGQWDDSRSDELSLISGRDEDGVAYTLAQEAQNNLSETDVFHTLDIPMTKDYRLVLSDGTVVWLNSETRLRYPAVFGRSERRVHLLGGEACFEVAKEEERGFLVEVNGHEIEALGTKFNVNAYPELMGAVETTLINGAVSVSNGTEAVLLSPGQQASATADALTVAEVDAGDYIGWIEGRFIFENKPLRDIMIRMARWYGFSVEFMDPETGNTNFTGMMEKSAPAQEIFDLMEKMAKIRFEVRRGGDRIVVRQR